MSCSGSPGAGLGQGTQLPGDVQGTAVLGRSPLIPSDTMDGLVLHGMCFSSHQGWKRSLQVCSLVNSWFLCARGGSGCFTFDVGGRVLYIIWGETTMLLNCTKNKRLKRKFLALQFS